MTKRASRSYGGAGERISPVTRPDSPSTRPLLCAGGAAIPRKSTLGVHSLTDICSEARSGAVMSVRGLVLEPRARDRDGGRHARCSDPSRGLVTFQCRSYASIKTTRPCACGGASRHERRARSDRPVALLVPAASASRTRGHLVGACRHHGAIPSPLGRVPLGPGCRLPRSTAGEMRSGT